MRRRDRIAAAALLGALGAGCAPEARGTAAESPANAASQARPPDFELRALDGSSVRLSEHLGKQVVLIDFWATYCEPCLRAMPELQALYAKYKAQGFLVLGVSIDGPDSLLSVRSDVQKLGISFPILLDQETRVVALYNPKTSAPFSVLIGKDGRVLTRREGYAGGVENTLEREIQAALR
ncbi:MAG TPA: TlpA disulfide reductase family protein [Polyangiaceae bacterium]|nr:TlpA disulfide reductase family protein [Polyangiaceae bacterium]